MKFPEKFYQYLEQKEVMGKSGKLFPLGGGSMSTINNLKVINNFYYEMQPKATLEIGLCHAGSALLLTSLHEIFGNPNTHHHVAMDPCQMHDWDQVGLEQIKKFGLTDFLRFYNDFSYNVLPSLIKKEELYDIIYIDGSHLFENVFIDFFYSLKLLNVGGVMLFDDSTNSNIGKVIRFIRSNFGFALKEIDMTIYNEKSGKDLLTYKIAKELGKVQLTGFRKTTLEIERHWSSECKRF